MAYLKFKKGTINKTPVGEENKRLILSEVIPSRCGPEYPKLISTKEDLDLYFDRDSVPHYKFYLELLDSGVGFLLGRPISQRPNPRFENYIDYQNYQKATLVSPVLPESPEDIIYLLKESDRSYYFLSSGEIIREPLRDTKELPLGPGGFYRVSEEYYLWTPSGWSLRTVLEVSKIPGSPRELLIDSQYIWISELSEYIDINILPQNLEVIESSESWTNRDTLRITTPGSQIPWCHPRYSGGISWDLSGWTSEKVSEETLRLVSTRNLSAALKVDFREVTSFRSNPPDRPYYLVLPKKYHGTDQVNITLWFSRDSSDTPPLGEDLIGNGGVPKEIEVSPEETLEESLEKLKEVLLGEGYRILEETPKVWTIYTNDFLRERYFTNIPGLKFLDSFYTTHDILDQLSKENTRLEFYSKLLGPSENPITITISKQSKKYLVIISKENYQEAYEGSFWIHPGESDFLPNLINRNSRLVSCKIQRTTKEGVLYQDTSDWARVDTLGNPILGEDRYQLHFGEFYYTWFPQGEYWKRSRFPKEGLVIYESQDIPEDPTKIVFNSDAPGEIPEGTWILRRAIEEEYTPEAYFNTLRVLREYGILEDFLLIPDIYCYHLKGSLDPDRTYFKEYEDLLEYAVEKNCQILIENSKLPWNLIETPDLPVVPEEGVIYQIPWLSDYYASWEGEESVEKKEPTVVSWDGNYKEELQDYTKFMIFSGGAWKEVSEERELIEGPESNFYFNLLGTDRLIYFYHNISHYETIMPGYYFFLTGLLEDSYSYGDLRGILYDFSVPLGRAWKYSSNTLETDNKEVFYSRILPEGVLERFIISRVSREFFNKKGSILAQTNSYEALHKQLDKIPFEVVYFYRSLVEGCWIDSFSIQGNGVEVNVTLRFYEMIDKDINLSLTINYN